MYATGIRQSLYSITLSKGHKNSQNTLPNQVNNIPFLDLVKNSYFWVLIIFCPLDMKLVKFEIMVTLWQMAGHRFLLEGDAASAT